jgi:peptide-methionine (S)-S-oxide reductase
VGYAGGHTQNPTYKQVCSGTSGHAEAVQLVYDSSKVSFADLVDFFYRMHEPHTLNRQGNDVGSQYRSAIFYHDEEQKKIAETVTETARKYYGHVSTSIEPVGVFYKAEDYHQDYLTTNPHGYECATHFGIFII